MAEKVTTMVLKVDLQCSCCNKKIKKILAKFPEIRSHIFDEKQNTVTITVACCNPEKIRCKLLCKGGKTIKCIEIIKEPPKPQKDKPPVDEKPSKKPQKTVPPPPDPKTPQSPKRAPPNPVPAIGCPLSYPIPVCCGPCYGGLVPILVPVPIIPKCVPTHKCPPVNPVPDCCGSCSEGNCGGPCYDGCGRPPPCHVPDCCGSCSEGNRGGPCYDGCGRPPPCHDGCGRPTCGRPPPCHDGCGSAPCHDGCGRQVPCHDGCGYEYGSGSGGCTSM